ncbi:MAG: hypothetical protein HY901_23805 [Deltaproteobacteria bacterium]|nr:hypothetical protein [Deltaproteobacteria bacterium]
MTEPVLDESETSIENVGAALWCMPKRHESSRLEFSWHFGGSGFAVKGSAMSAIRNLEGAVITVLLSVRVLAACSCDRVEDAGVDGGNPGVDASRPMDAALTALDAGFGADASTADAQDSGPTDTSLSHEPPYPPGLCPDSPTPDDVPPGWQRYDGFACTCPVYIPGVHGTPLPPFEWEPCQAPIPDYLGCRRLKMGWGFAGRGLTSAFPYFWRDPIAGRSYLEMGRHDPATDRLFSIVAELDGSVHVAFLQRQISTRACAGASEQLANGRYVFAFRDRTRKIDGFIAGKVEDTYPSRVFSKPYEEPYYSDWAASSEWIVRFHANVSKMAWDGAQFEVVSTPSQATMAQHSGIALGQNILWPVGSGDLRGVLSWTPAYGTRQLLLWPNDPTHSAFDFATDGTDMVWTQSYERDSSDHWSRFDIMAAPYTTDPAKALGTARRLRSDYSYSAPFSYAVGCGYAAHQVYWNGREASLLIVRLSDGVSWILSGAEEDGGWMYGPPVGIACDANMQNIELIGRIWKMFEWSGYPDSTLIRIPMANLGPGIAPD